MLIYDFQIILQSSSPRTTCFDPLQLSHDFSVNRAMLEAAEGVPSWKFLPLLYQIASRMGLPESAAVGAGAWDGEGPQEWEGTVEKPSFQGVLIALVLKMAEDHPYHTLPQVRPRCASAVL